LYYSRRKQVRSTTGHPDHPDGDVAYLKFVFLFAVWLVALIHPDHIQAQNLVPNPSFETLSECPSYFGGVGMSFAPPWESAHSGTPDVYHECATFPSVGVPDNIFGSEYAHTGQGYAGVFTYINSYEYREYMLAPLNQTLVAGNWYRVSMFVSTPEEACGVNSFGIYLTDDWFWQFGIEALPLSPQIVATEMITETDGWVEVSACIQSNGHERIIIIGNFNDDANTTPDPSCSYNVGYYYFDDVSVELVAMPDELPLELGDPVTVCSEYTIDPGLSDYYYTWSDSSHLPTLDVTESGVYILTITDGACNFGIDSVEVTILNTLDPIDIGPPAITICEGESYDIMLDPDLSEYTWNNGSHDPNFSITQTGTYAVTLDDGCSEVSDEISVTVLEPPLPVDLGEDGFICTGDQINWYLDPSQGNYTWQDGNTSPTYTASSDGIYSVTVTNMCGSTSDEITLSALSPPEVDLGDEDLSLCTGDSITIDLDPMLGDFVWQDGSMASSYTINGPGTYAVTVSNSCGAGTDAIEVWTLEPPIADLGPDTFLCTGEQILLVRNPEADSWVWQDQSTEPTLLVTSGGNYSLTVENSCGSTSDDIYIEQLEPVTIPNLGPDISLCPGEQVILHAGNPGAEYIWQDFTNAESFVVTQPGTYFVQVYNECNLVSDTIVVSLNSNPPQVDLADTLQLCSGETLLLDPGLSGVDYLWNDQTQLSTLQVTVPGMYSVTISNSCGMDQDSVIVLSGGIAPAVDLGTDIGICQGDSILLQPISANVDQWIWQDGSTGQQYIITEADTISVVVSNGCGTTMDTLIATWLPQIPVLNLGPDTSICPGQPLIFTVTENNVLIEWFDGSQGSSLITDQPGVISASISNQCGQSFDTVVVYSLQPPPVLDLGPDQSLCPGETILISPGIMDVDYLWQDGSTNASYSTMQEETIILTVTNECGSDTDTLLINENNLGPQVELGEDITACENEIITVSANILGVDYLWQDGSTSSTYTTSISETVILQVSNNCGTDTDTLQIQLTGTTPVFNLGPDIEGCSGSSVILSPGVTNSTLVWQDGSASATYEVTATGQYFVEATNQCGSYADSILVDFSAQMPLLELGDAISVCEGAPVIISPGLTDVNYLWQDGSTGSAYTATQSENVILAVSNACGTATDTITVDILDAPDPFSLGPDTTLCLGETILLSSPSIFYDVLWQDGSGMLHFVVNRPGTYSLTLSNSCGTASDEILIDYDTRVPQIDIDPMYSWCEGDVISLDVTQPFDATYLWNTGLSNPSVSISTPGIYSVDIATSCLSRTFEIVVEEDDDCLEQNDDVNIYIPNVFSPNGDGINDLFTIGFNSGLNVVSVSGKIYDRWGGLVYSAVGTSFSWDGSFADEVMMPGVYVYVLHVEYVLKGTTQFEEYTGDVTLVR
jgi:gliding motility-associated-like protein